MILIIARGVFGEFGFVEVLVVVGMFRIRYVYEYGVK